jgi:type IV pilus assembly protein PilM
LKFDFFTTSAPHVIGVDISSAFVKMVDLSADKAGYKLESYAIVPLAKAAMADGNIANLDSVVDAIRRALKQLGTREKSVALALPAAAVITKKVLMPAGMREEEMEVQVEAEAHQYIPFPLDEVNIDFQVLGPAPNNPEEEVEVLIAASRKERIEDRIAAAEAAGLKVVIMDVETYATEAAYTMISQQLPNGAAGQTVMIADIGASMMHVDVLHDNQSVYTSEQSFGGSQLTLEIQRRYGLTPEEAEIGKLRGGLPENYELDVLQPFVQTLATEVARAVQFFTSSTQYNHVDHIVLAGGCAAIPALSIAVQERTRANTVVANPFHGMKPGSAVKTRQIASDAPALLIACGLAMRSFSQ